MNIHRVRIMASPSGRAALSLCVAALLASNPYAALPVQDQSIQIPKDTPVTLRLEQAISSADAHIGDPVRFTLAKDIVVGSQSLAKNDLVCASTVTKVRPKTAQRDGEIDYSHPVCDLGHGQLIRLVFVDSSAHRDDVEMVVGMLTVFLITSPVTVPWLIVREIKRTHHPKTALGPTWKPQDRGYLQGEESTLYVRNAIRVHINLLAASQPNHMLQTP